MKREKGLFAFLEIVIVLVCSVLIPTALAQSLTQKLAEEKTFYRNYGRDTYSMLKIEKDVVGLYDMFGEHITDGVHVYDLSQESRKALRKKDELPDSMLYSVVVDSQRSDFYEKFQNLVITQDAIGGLKTSFLVGNQITTRFTPLTFNMVNFRGVRWDIWSSGIQSSIILSKTRPYALSKKGLDARSSVSYPLNKTDFPEAEDGIGFRGNSLDYSSRSPTSDYDMLVAFHGENSIANKVDVGVSYINHHVSDIREGEKWLSGNIPSEWMPSHIHFEFYDATPEDTNDAGVYVDSMRMFVNGIWVVAKPQYQGRFCRVFVGDRDAILLPRDIPIARPQNGYIPIIVEFKVDPEYYRAANPSQQGAIPLNMRGVKEIEFEYRVAGNYLVFVSTDRQIPLGLKGKLDPQTNEIEYEQIQKSVGQIYDQNLAIYQSPPASSPQAYQERRYSTTYFGQYIAQSPQFISVSSDEFRKAFEKDIREKRLYGNPSFEKQYKDIYNYRTYRYRYALNVSSVTYGINFKGDIAGIKFGGELALNRNTDMTPGRTDSKETKNKFVAVLNAERELGKIFGITSELYMISPQWRTDLDKLEASRYFNKTTYKREGGNEGLIPDYLQYPTPLSSNWSNIDDNEDQDPFVENNRRIYPSDRGPDSQSEFYTDGTKKWLSDNTLKLDSITRETPAVTNNSLIKGLYLPQSRMWIPYDDPDGVVASKDDRNKNSIPDYQEDFLLFSSDPPEFELGIDINNNGIPDYEDDDILPDYGHSVGYVVTGNGIRTQGVAGLNMTLRSLPLENTVIEIGGVGESVLDRDLDISGISSKDNEAVSDFWHGRSIVGYLSAKQDVLKRSQGIQYQPGIEIRLIRDAIRNDAVRSQYMGANDYSYYYITDPLNFRKAVVANLVGSVTYNNIPNFEYGIRLKLGGQQHFEIPGKFYTMYTLIDPIDKSLMKGTGYDAAWSTYPTRTVGDIHFVNRLSYKIGFRKDYEGWRSAFNFLNKFELIPMYKLAFSFKRELAGPEETRQDPRDLEQHFRLDINKDDTITKQFDDIGYTLDTVRQERIQWAKYQDRNYVYLLNVPIVRASYKIAENTQFQLGLQWKRYIDFISPEANALSSTILAQIVSRAPYRGYAVTLFIGGRWYFNSYDITEHNPVLSQGKKYMDRGSQLFVKVYSGI